MKWFKKLPISIRLSIGYAMWSSFLIIVVSFGCYKTIEILLYRSIDTALLSVARSINETYFSEQFKTKISKKNIKPYIDPSFQKCFICLKIKTIIKLSRVGNKEFNFCSENCWSKWCNTFN